MTKWQQYYVLTKPRVVQLIVFCAFIGMLLAIDGLPNMQQWRIIILANLGIGLVAGAAAAYNCLVEKLLDSKMRRTAWRPSAQGLLSDKEVLLLSTTLCVLGCGILWYGVNALTMLLTLATFVGYAIVYTVFLKPLTPQNIVIGGASGAMPPVLGWTAITNGLDPAAWLLFLIIFVWTPPHFWALSLYRVDDYIKAGLPMLPATHGNTFTRVQMLFYTLALLVVSVLPFFYGMNSVFYLVVAIVIGWKFIYLILKLWQNYSESLAKRTFKYSLWYLALLFLVLLIDHYIVVYLFH